MQKIFLGKSVNPGTYRQDYYNISVWNRYNVSRQYTYYPNQDIGKMEQLIVKFSLVEYDYFYEDFHKYLNTNEDIKIYLDDNGIFAQDVNGAIFRMLDYEFWFESISELWKYPSVEHVPPGTSGLSQQRPQELIELRLTGIGKLFIKEIKLSRDTDFPIPPLPESRISKYMRLYGEYVIKRNMLLKLVQEQYAIIKDIEINILEDKVEEIINFEGSEIILFTSCTFRVFINSISEPLQVNDTKLKYYIGYKGADV